MSDEMFLGKILNKTSVVIHFRKEPGYDHRFKILVFRSDPENQPTHPFVVATWMEGTDWYWGTYCLDLPTAMEVFDGGKPKA